MAYVRPIGRISTHTRHQRQQMAKFTPIARRLNEVQKAVGLKHSFREFWRTLVDEEFWKQRGKRPPNVSREAARTYHLDRDPPTSYLEHVVERWDVNPSWLLTGEPEGLLFMEEVREAQAARLDEADNPLWQPALEGVPQLANWSTPARVLFLDVLDHYLVSFEGHELLEEQPEHRRMEAIQALAMDLFGMVNVEYHSLRPVTYREFTYYMVAMLHAVQLRIPEPDRGGPHLFVRFPTLSPEYRQLMEADFEGIPEVDISEKLNRPLTDVQPTRWSPKPPSNGESDA